MKRTDFILLWVNNDENDFRCNSELCKNRRELGVDMTEYVNQHCPILSSPRCSESKWFRNDKDIIIATIKECKAKELRGCIRNCNTCVTGLLIKTYKEKKLRI